MPNGRPPKYKSADQLEKALIAYFNYCSEAHTMPNKAGLCVALKISRDTYSEYRTKFPDTIKEADAIIENAWVQHLCGPNATGAIFYLKNAFSSDYRDRTETDMTSGGEKVQVFQLIPPHDRKDSADN